MIATKSLACGLFFARVIVWGDDPAGRHRARLDGIRPVTLGFTTRMPSLMYRARDTRLDRTVAIKVLPSQLAGPQLRERFDREARAISSLRLANVSATEANQERRTVELPHYCRDAGGFDGSREYSSGPIEVLETVLKLDPDYPFARLGYAWCLDQAGKKVEAIEAYRDMIREAWPRERDLTHAGVGWRSITAETAGYLIRLLDPDSDKEEIASLQERIAQMAKVPRAITPIVVPLRDGVNAADLVDSSAQVLFDADGTGIKKPWTWINKDAGWLVFNPWNAEVTSTRPSGKIATATAWRKVRR